MNFHAPDWDELAEVSPTVQFTRRKAGMRLFAFKPVTRHPDEERPQVAVSVITDWNNPTRAISVTYGDPKNEFFAPPTMRQIIDFVSLHYGYTREQLCGDRKWERLAEARHVAFWMMDQHTTQSLSAMGKALGNRDHTTIRHGIRRITKAINDQTDTGARALLCEAAFLQRRKRY